MTERQYPRPWQWPEDQWRGCVNRVRAGKPLTPPWPEGKHCAVALSFDVDHETNELRDGGKSIGRLSWGQYGSRRGMPRIMALLKKHDIQASFFVPAIAAKLYPDEQRAVRDQGHEIGLHGWIHELNSGLPKEAERDLMLRSAEALEQITGILPVGMRTPSWDFSDNTLSIAREMRLLYDSSLMADDSCYELLQDGKRTGIVEIPVEWIRDDALYLIDGRLRPDDVLGIFLREFEKAYEEAQLFQLTMHPHVIGYRSRIWILEEIIRAAKAKGDVWFATHRQVAEHASAAM
ncbi:MAG: polysaccharide deacetylase [Mesorhizobium sp.]|uniref:polysaccharide deacetylase family protein n=1 Tax=unclassified Mesorhizobium TaxID=325217 RepID=UPI000FCC4FC7|nr:MULTISPECIES: polysaccharide deacetylase [unclassified Mesorhizobium]RUW80941.1 polysaccharide deacetylase [Mesorhizobium sp. M1E.F.Ca.ET.063.01.1.1]TIW10376.1 MAG: polysaccharide deacetylase [Mesorhizobium sp.]